LLVGIVNATNTGDINSDRSTWLFLSIVYVVREIRRRSSAVNICALPTSQNARA
jgi:hypothetical protein